MDQISALASTCRIAAPNDTVTNSECVYTFHSPYTTEKGIVVSLSTFVGTVDELAGEQRLFVRICKKRIPKKIEDDQKTAGATKLGVGVEGGFLSESDKFETISTYSIVILAYDSLLGKSVAIVELKYNNDTKSSFPIEVSQSADSIINNVGLAVQQDLKAWELDDEPKPVSKYADALPFVDNGVKVSSNPSDWKCEMTGEKTEHIWLNLSDGFIGGGRKNWDGSGGTNGALDHFLETGELFPLVVKLGTITEDLSTADCYSYAKDEDGPVVIPNLKELLEKRGILVAGLQKTVKSTAELEVELNATYAFDAITEAGSELIPISGPGLHGLQNLGNSCYMNSVVQMLFSGLVPEISSRYGAKFGDVTKNPILKRDYIDASKDVLCQATKLCSALTSGEFCPPTPTSMENSDHQASDPKYRLSPRMFKHAVGHDHVDFRTGQQQDAAEYFQVLLEKIHEGEKFYPDPTKRTVDDNAYPKTSHLFSYRTEFRVVCEADNKIKYNLSPPETMLTLRIPKAEATSDVPDLKRLRSEEHGEEGKQKKSVPVVSFDECLAEWSTPTVIEDYRSGTVGRAFSSTRLANFPRYLLVKMQRYELGDDWVPQKIEVEIDVPEEVSFQGLRATGPQAGEHLVDDSDNPTAASSPALALDESSLAQLMDMGFSMNGCKRALVAVGGSNVEAAMNWIFEHNADPDFNDPLPDTGTIRGPPDSKVAVANEGDVVSLVENLGCFTSEQVRAALNHCGAVDRAADWLFSHMDDLDGAISQLAINNASEGVNNDTPSTFPLEDGEGKYTLVGLISHIGKNTSSGHYIAHLKKDGKWVIFNDEKVALSEHPPIKHAYLYLFQRSDTVGSPHPGY